MVGIEQFTLQHTTLVVIFVLLGILLWKVMRSEENTIEWWQFISTRGPDGKHYADVDKLGKVVGIIVSSWVVTTNKTNEAMLFIYLAYVGAVGGWSAYLRARNGQTTTELPPKSDSPPKAPTS